MISSCNSATDNRNSLSDLSSVMSVDRQSSTPIDSDTENTAAKNNTNNIVRRTRPSRACTVRSAARLHAAAAAEAAIVAAQRKKKRKERPVTREESPPSPSPPQDRQCSKIVTALVGEPEPSQLPRWNIRSMWELASILNFLNVFRTILNIKVEFSAEEFETALITPNITLADIHIPLLKAIPPIARMALGENTWITVLCRKLRDWWHWVADGELPIIASHGNEIEAYNTLDPGVRVVILKALCDIRVEQEDIRNYIDNSIKHGVHLSTFRKERIGGDSHGISYWYEDDPIIGQRLYREIRTVEVKKGKGKGVQPIPVSCYQWETAATNPDEFEDVSEKLFSSKNRTEASLGKKLKIDVLPEIEKVQKTKERLLKKQQRQALLLDNMMSVDGLPPGRSLRGRKNVSYTFDDYDRSITEAINVTKRKQSSPGPTVKREGTRSTSTNGRLGGPLEFSQQSFSMPSPESFDDDEIDEDLNYETFDRSRRRQRPERYSAKDFVEELSDNDAEFDSDDEIVGEAVYDDEYLKKRKEMRKMSSSSEGDEEYRWEGENVEEEEEEEEEEEDYSLSMSDDSGERPTRRSKKLPGRTRRETKLRSVGEFRSGLRRSNRATRNRVDYKKLEVSDSETESLKPEKSNASDEHTDASDNEEFTMESETEDSEPNYNDQDRDIESPAEEQFEAVEEDQPEEQFEAVDEDQPYEQFEAVDEDQPDEQFEAVDEDQHEAVDEEQFEAVDEDQPEAVDEEQPEAVYENQPKAVYRNQHEAAEEEKIQFPHKADSAVHNEADIIQKRGFLDLNELAPGSGFDDGPNSIMKGDDTDNF